MTTQTAAKHTPGPWGISHGGLPGDSGFSVVSRNADAENVKVTAECWPCTIVSEDHRRELFANARLIAAAPELLESLASCVEALDHIENTMGLRINPPTLDKAQAVIRKATGTNS